jgi:ribose-phosphate pyrophosphokinase
MNTGDLRLFALDETREFAQRVAAACGVPLGEHEERDFDDGEHKIRPLCSVRGADVYVVQSLYGGPEKSVNDKLVRLLFFIGALKDASAARVTVVAPYLCYARKDRKSKSRDPVTTRYVAQLLEAAGADRVMTLDVHNLAAYENAFRIPAEHLEAKRLFVDHFAPLAGRDPVVVVSPDVGGVKRAEAFRDALERRLGRPVDRAFMEKYRSAGVVSGDRLVGDVAGRTAIIIDDLISTGGTIARATAACTQRGAKAVHAAASHGVFGCGAGSTLAGAGLAGLVTTDTIPPFRLESAAGLAGVTVLGTATLFAAAIRCIHEGGSIVSLLET